MDCECARCVVLKRERALCRRCVYEWHELSVFTRALLYEIERCFPLGVYIEGERAQLPLDSARSAMHQEIIRVLCVHCRDMEAFDACIADLYKHNHACWISEHISDKGVTFEFRGPLKCVCD